MQTPKINCCESFMTSPIGRCITSFIEMISNVVKKIFSSCFGKKEEAKPIDPKRVEVQEKSDLPPTVTPVAKEPEPEAAKEPVPQPEPAPTSPPSNLGIPFPTVKPMGTLEGGLPEKIEAFAQLPGDRVPERNKNRVTVTFSEGGISRVVYSFKEGKRPYLEVKFSHDATRDLRRDLHADENEASHRYTDLSLMQANWAILNEKVDLPEDAVAFINKKLGITVTE